MVILITYDKCGTMCGDSQQDLFNNERIRNYFYVGGFISKLVDKTWLFKGEDERRGKSRIIATNYKEYFPASEWNKKLAISVWFVTLAMHL